MRNKHGETPRDAAAMMAATALHNTVTGLRRAQEQGLLDDEIEGPPAFQAKVIADLAALHDKLTVDYNLDGTLLAEEPKP